MVGAFTSNDPIAKAQAKLDPSDRAQHLHGSRNQCALESDGSAAYSVPAAHAKGKVASNSDRKQISSSAHTASAGPKVAVVRVGNVVVGPFADGNDETAARLDDAIDGGKKRVRIDRGGPGGGIRREKDGTVSGAPTDERIRRLRTHSGREKSEKKKKKRKDHFWNASNRAEECGKPVAS